ncbi:TIR domain-containing protein [Sphingomonas sp. KR1UV-12]|uniref:TIR domain-containing protein n=1 Tax=Sphingomonas aurea TaxID=3063994 RepID=A0ABT9EIW3_9SPHN|nr:TIR domain-containing protein [Sphingomonas sp. KR1UV-12]MDP1026854.1 TIR domain-containing protein [Sphingomonas sp. KR1UV-12]
MSYKSEDRARVAPLVAALEADGVGVWWDAHIGGGSEWRDSIESELNAAACVVVVWSERSTGREGSFVRDEATRSLRRGAYLPVRIDPVEPPLGFGETQALSLIGWKGDRTDPQYVALLAAVQAVIAGKPRPTPPAYQQPKRGLDRRLVIGGGVAAIAVAGAGGWWALTRDVAPGDSVAVLPFANLSGDPAQAFFSDGIAEELRDALTRIASLKVAGRSSSEQMRDADAPTAAAKLGVASILSGTVRRGAGMIRINAELVDGISGLTRWSQAYDRAIGDTLAIQSDIADSVAGALKIALGGAQKALLVQGGTSNPVAQEAYLRGLALARKNKIKESLPQFEAAIAADPNYAKAYLSLGGNGAALASNSLSGAALRAKLDAAEQTVRHALALMPGSGKPYAALGLIFQGRLDLRRARDAYDTAYRALPGDATVLRTKSLFDSLMGNSDAIGLYQRAMTLDPLRAANGRSQANLLFNVGRLDQAIVVARTNLATLPDDPFLQTLIATVQLIKGQAAEAARTATLVATDDPNRPAADVVGVAAVSGPAADRALSSFLANYGATNLYEIAQIHGWRGERDLAFAAIARAWEERNPALIQFKTDPLLAPIRSDPRYGEWLRKIGFP